MSSAIDPWSTSSPSCHPDGAIVGLGQGLIFPQQGLQNSRFFKSKSKAEDLCTEWCNREDPEFIRIFVGPKKALQEWLRSAGPGSCTLWAEFAEESMDLNKPDISHRLFKAQLLLAYRLRSATPLLQPVFPGTHLILSPQISKGEGPFTMQEEEEEFSGSPVCGKWHSLRQREKEKFLRSIGVNHLGDHFCVKHGQTHQSDLRKRKWIQKWLLGMPVSLYGQLASMIAPGGSLWQFQQIVEKIVHNLFFVDVDFELIDFRLWLKNHKYIALLGGLDLLVVLSTLHWTAVRFDFAVNEHIKIRTGKCLSSLHRFLQEKKEVNLMADGKRTNGGSTLHPSDEKGAHSFCSSETRMWKSWYPSDQEFSLQCASLVDAMYKEGGFSESRSGDAFKHDFGFLKGREEHTTKDLSHSSSRVQELRSCRSPVFPLLSSKEKCALSNLGSSSRIVRQRGLYILLTIFLGDSKGKYQSTLADSRIDCLNGRELSTPVSGNSLSNAINGSTPKSGDVSSNESSRVVSGSEKGDYIKAKDSTRKQFRISSSLQNDGVPSRSSPSSIHDMKHESLDCQIQEDSQRFSLSCDDRHAKETECLDFSWLFDHREVSCKVESVQMKLLEWVQCGFLENLIEEALCSAGKTNSRKETRFTVDEIADVCLKTISALPMDSSIRIVDSMMLWLKDCSTDNELVTACTAGNSGLKLQEDCVDADSNANSSNSLIQKLGEQLERTCCSAKLLLLLVEGSTFIASNFARCGGLSTVLGIYNSLVRLGFSLQSAPTCPLLKIGYKRLGETLPGGVTDSQMANLIVPPFLTSVSNGFRQQHIVNSITPQSVPSLGDQSAEHESFSMKKRNKCRVLAQRICKTVGHTIMTVFHCKRRRLCALFDYISGRNNRLSLLSQSNRNTVEKCLADASKYAREPDDVGISPFASPTVDKHEASSEIRRKVPKLMLKPCLVKEKKKAGDWTENSFMSMGTLSASSSSNTSSKAVLDCCAYVLEAKQYLLEALNLLLMHHSAATLSAQQELATKLSSDVHNFVSSFICDMFFCFNNFPCSDGKKLQGLIFEVMYQLDKVSAQTDFRSLISASDEINQPVGMSHDLVISEPPPRDKHNRIISETFHREVLENLRAIFASVVGPENGDKRRLAFRTWQSIGTLMGIIAEYGIFSLNKGLPVLFKNFGAHFESAFAVFSEIGEPSSWNLSQILAMQNLLNSITIISQELKNDRVYSTTLWTDWEEQIWQVIIGNQKNWELIKGYLSWLVLESCHGCFKNLLNYWKFCSETPEALAVLLFSKSSFCLESPGFGCLRDAFECLGFFVTLFHRRMCAKLSPANDGFSLLLPQEMASFFDFLMNPVDGLLMNTLKGPCFQGRIIHTEREFENHALDCRMMSQENIFLLRVSQELDISPSCKLSSAKLSATSTSDLSSSARVSRDKDCSNRFASQLRYGILPIQSWSWQKPSRLQTFNYFPQELNSKTPGFQSSSDAEPSDTFLSSQLEHSQCSCKSCATQLILRALSLRLSILIEEKSLDLLAQVFRLKFSANVDMEQLQGVRAKKVLENPFLSKRHVDAFLDFHFLSFLQLYNWKTNNNPNLPMKQSVFRTDCASEEEGSANLDTIATDTLPTLQSASPHISTSLSEDETITLACQKHGEVLVALSQNQTSVVSRRFKELKVMEFLMNQIALEYELSHVVTPRKSVPELALCDVLQTKDHTAADITIGKCKVYEQLLAGKRTFPKGRMDIESFLSFGLRNSEQLSQISQEKQRKQLAGASASCNVIKSGRSLRKSSGSDSSTTQSRDVDSLKISHVPGLVAHNLSLQQHRLLTCISTLQTPGNWHGSLTCRDELNLLRYGFPFAFSGDLSSIGRKNKSCNLPIQQQELINFHFRLPSAIPRLLKAHPDSRKAIKTNHILEIPFEKQGCFTCHGKMHNDCNCFDLNQYESSSFLFNEEVFGNLEVPSSAKELVVFSSNTGSISYRKSARNLVDDKSSTTSYVSSNKTKGTQSFVYSGRFCDLNEEVENELAKEDATMHCEKDNKKRAGSSKKSENAAPKSGRKISVGSPRSNAYADRQSQKSIGLTRPLVPKLNLPKSARKGDEHVQPVEGQEKDISTEIQKVQDIFSSENNYCKSDKVVSEKDHCGDDNEIGNLSYERERTKRRMYRDCKLHVLLLELFVSLMITPQGGLETCYTDRFPTEGQKMNAPFYLLYHINHIGNAELWPSLRGRMKSFHPSVFRILKLLWRDLFNPSLYTNRQRIAHGAFAQIYTARFTESNRDSAHYKTVVLKTVDLPKGPHEPCKFFDIYSEVEILEKFAGDSRICQLLDYGVDIESFILVLKHYKCSLRYWRQQHTVDSKIGEHISGRLSQAFHNKLPLYLEVYSSILQAVKVLESHNVVHYDLKCDNILLEPVESNQSDEEFWNPVWYESRERPQLPFRVCIADFGQSKASILKGGECTVRNRGTECVKSPEMLKLLSTIKQEDEYLYMPAKDESVGRAVDVWGLGCLLYELLTGEYLLYDEDWTRFFIRVTLPSENLITDEKAAKLDHYEPIMKFLNYILVRDPLKRPTLDEVILQLEQLQLKLRADNFGNNDCIVQSAVDSNLKQKLTSANCQSVSAVTFIEKSIEQETKPMLDPTCLKVDAKNSSSCQKVSDEESCRVQCTTIRQSSEFQASSAPLSSPWSKSHISKLICGG